MNAQDHGPGSRIQRAVALLLAAAAIAPAWPCAAQSEPPRLQSVVPGRQLSDPPRLQAAGPPGTGTPGLVGDIGRVPAPPVGVVPTLPPAGPTSGSGGAAQAEPVRTDDLPRGSATSLQSVQHAWTIGVPAPGQDRPGVKRVPWDGGGVVRVTTRRYVYTTIVLPGCEAIEQVLMGDAVNWAFRLDEKDPANPTYRPARNRVDILPKGSVGIDTTATLITASGRIYPFYLSATDVDAPDIPDVVVQVDGPRLCGVETEIANHVLRRGTAQRVSLGAEAGGVTPRAALPGERVDDPLSAPPGFNPPAQATPGPMDYLRDVPVAVRDLRFDKVQILMPEDDSRAIAPLRVFDDGRWTYVDFGIDRIDSMRLPQAYLTEDGVDHLVNTSLAGARGEILVIKAIGDMTLKSGRLYVCLRRVPKGLDAFWTTTRPRGNGSAGDR